MVSSPQTITRQVKVKSGWLAVFENEQQAVVRVTRELNRDGYYVVAVYPAGNFSAMEQLVVAIFTLLTLGMWGRRPGMVIVAERASRRKG